MHVGIRGHLAGAGNVASATPEAGGLTTCSNSSPDASGAKPAKASADILRSEQRARGYRLRRHGRAMVVDIHDTLAHCGLGVIANPDGSPGSSRFSCDHGKGSVHHRGVMTCHNPWACPVCAPKIATRRALALTPQIEQRVADGWTVSLMTLTLRHRRRSSLADMLAGLSKAWAKVTSGRWFDKLRKVDLLSFVRGYDCTYSDAHGWHPHIHVTLMLGPEHEDETVCEAITERWQEALSKLGWTTTRKSQDYFRADNPAAAAKYAVTPAAVYEALALAMKRARGEGAGTTPFEILERAAADREAGVKGSKWVALWREYVSAIKGKKQVVTSQDLTLDLPEQEHGDEDTVLEVGGDALKEMDRRNLVPAVLDAMEERVGDPDGMRQAVKVVMDVMESRDWCMPAWHDPGRTRAGSHASREFRTEKDDIDREAEAIPDPPPPRNPYAPVPPHAEPGA